MSSDSTKGHHELLAAVIQQEECDAVQLTCTIKEFTNPFSSDVTDLHNLVTKVAMPDAVKKDLLSRTGEGWPEIIQHLCRRENQYRKNKPLVALQK